MIYEKENPEDAVSLGVILILMVQFKFILDFWTSKNFCFVKDFFKKTRKQPVA